MQKWGRFRQSIVMQLTNAARATATFIALIAWTTIVTQLWISIGKDGGLGPAVWNLIRYFTLLTNIMVAFSFANMALTGRALKQGWLAGLTLWILIVGVVYHVLLASQYHLTGLDWWTDQGFHTADPILVALWWLAFAPKREVIWRHAAIWLAWPLIYTIYALIRSPLEGQYPYFFLDAGQFGYGQVALNSVGLCAAFYASGMGIVGIGKLLSRGTYSESPG